MKKHSLVAMVTVGLMMSIGACSSSQTVDDEGLDNMDAMADSSEPGDVAEGEADTDIAPPAVEDAFPAVDEASPSAAEGSGESVQEGAAQQDATTPGLSGSVASVPMGDAETYTVQKGDTLMKIAFETYGDISKWREIYDANRDKIQDPNQISKGMTLSISKPGMPISIAGNGERYLIKQGDTLGTISNAVYGTQSRWKEIWENNKQLIQNPNVIYAGFYLYYVPGAGGSHLSAVSPDKALPVQQRNHEIAMADQAAPTALPGDSSSLFGQIPPPIKMTSVDSM